jgi:nucleoside-diphosphate-sugar epimerase
MPLNPLSADLDFILDTVSPFWRELKNQHIFITGGTGFFGCWLLNSFIHASDKLNLNAHATVLTRDINAFKKKCPELAEHPSLNFYEGDVKNFTFRNKHYSHIIHAATDTAESDPVTTLDTIIQGTQHTLDFAKHCKSARYLLVSSGAIYGKQPPELPAIPEDYPGRPLLEDPRSAYGIGKCTAEHLCHLYKQYGIDIKIARCFAFVGPYLPLNAQFAIGNFLSDAAKGGPIIVNGDGTPFRSYLYAADLTVWLWKILFCGQPLQPYNVGSNEAVSIAELAHLIAGRFSPKLEVIVKKAAPENKLAARYVPDVTRAKNELGLIQKINLVEAIDKTLNWFSIAPPYSRYPTY